MVTSVLAAVLTVPAADVTHAATTLSWTAAVTRIIDGDTFEAKVAGSATAVVVRVAGINTNETYSANSDAPECHASGAGSRLAQLISGKTVQLRARSASSSSLGRQLRHVFSGSTNIATQMIGEGWGLPLVFDEEPDYTTENTAAAHRAQAAGLHLWDTDACGAGPTASIEMVTQYDAEGVDDTNPNGEWVQLRNTAALPLDLTRWELRDAGLPRYTFPTGFALPAGGRVRIYVGIGTNTATALFMGHASSLLSNDADGMFLHDPDFDIRAYDLWPCAAGCGPSAPLVIDTVHYDAVGDDVANPNGEWFTIRNVGEQVVDLKDWMIEAPPYQITSVASRPIAPHGIVRVFLGPGTSTTGHLFFNRSTGALTNTGGSVLIWTPARDIGDCAAWGQGTCASRALGSRLDLTANWDAAGDDLVNPNGEWVNVTNTSTTSINLSGFAIQSPPHSFTIPAGTTLAAGARLRLYVGAGTPTTTTLYWGKASGLLDNGGDVVTLSEPSGNVVRSFRYPCVTECGPPPPLVVDEVHADAEGDDLTNPNGEWIRLRNVSSAAVDLRDWQVVAGSRALNPTESRRMSPGAVVTIYSGTGTNTATAMYWQQPSGMLTNTGASVQLFSPHRDRADCASWGVGTCPSDRGPSGSVGLTVRFDAAGDDAANPNGEWVNVSNRGSAALDLTGWMLSTPGHLYRFSATSLDAGARVRVRIGAGSDTATERHWGLSQAVLGNSGDLVTLVDPLGQEVRTVQWPCGGGRCGQVDDLVIDRVVYDAPRDDLLNPNGEKVFIRNAGAVPLDLRDWSLESAPYVFDIASSTVLQPGGLLTVRIGSGTTSSTTRYWGFSAGILTNAGDSVRLVSPSSDTADCVAWGTGRC
jgi:endonuclease YncB( thermonuclease family)